MINLFGNLNLNSNSYSNIGDGSVVTNNTQIVDNNHLLAQLRMLLPGQTLEGQLVNQDGKVLQLLLGGNALLNTTLDSQANLEVGQNISFEVKSNNNGHLVLRPLHTNMSNDATAIKALESASVKVSEETIKMVDSLMKEGMPINKDILQSINREINMYPDADVNDIVMLHKLNMPVNDNNISQMHLYNNNNQWMMGNVNTMSEDVIDLLASSDSEQYTALVDKLETLFEQEGESVIDTSKTDGKTDMTGDGKIIISEENLNNSEQITNKDVFKLLKELSPDKLNDKELAETIKGKLNEAIGNKFLMEPDKVADKEYVKSYYDKILETSKELESFLAQNGKSDTNLAKDMSGIKNNIDFMNQMNELYNYVQLPLKMAGAQAQGDLYVYSKKHNKKSGSEDEPLTALLHLSMETLGNMDIFLKLTQGKLTTDFSLEKEEMIDFIESHIDELNKRLIDKGYNVTTKVGKLSDEQKNVIDEIKSESPQISILSSQTFDARA